MMMFVHLILEHIVYSQSRNAVNVASDPSETTTAQEALLL